MAGKPTDKPAWSPEEVAAMHEFMGTWNKELVESGEFVDARGLAAPVHTRRVQGCKNGVPVVTDGPYPETQEVLAGYTIVECESFDRATEIAARLAKSRTRSTRAERRVVRGRAADPRGRRRPGGVTTAVTGDDVEDLLRQLAPQVLGAVVRRYGHFDTAEDADAGGAARGRHCSGRRTASRTTRAAG